MSEDFVVKMSECMDPGSEGPFCLMHVEASLLVPFVMCQSITYTAS